MLAIIAGSPLVNKTLPANGKRTQCFILEAIGICLSNISPARKRGTVYTLRIDFPRWRVGLVLSKSRYALPAAALLSDFGFGGFLAASFGGRAAASVSASAEIRFTTFWPSSSMSITSESIRPARYM